MTRVVNIGDISIGGGNPFVLFAGPCVIEDESLAIDTAIKIKEICGSLKIPYVYKSSYDKANRTSVTSPRGPGISGGLSILKKVKEEVGVPILSDVHSTDEVDVATEVLDVIQIPAFLCRQTDLLIKCGKTEKPVNVKKGQFLAPHDVTSIIEKIESTGNKKIIITERGATFGYNNLVVDFRSFPIMREGLSAKGKRLSPGDHPTVVFDATHSVQLPGAGGNVTGGDREFIPYLARGAAAVGVDGIFMEVHPDPPSALCDATNQLYLRDLEAILRQLFEIDSLVKGWEAKK
jgi:2-dehydro-3-deoxyphosphooctonate aldolase (KDO 8-P synthase)